MFGSQKQRIANHPGLQSSIFSSKSRVLVLKRNYRNIGLVVSFLTETNLTIDQSVKSVVLTHTYIESWVVNSTSLTNEDVTCLYHLITEFLDTESFAM